MQVQVEGFFNPDGRDASGHCCLPPDNNTTAATTCGGECRTFFRVCAAKVGPNWPEETDLRQHTLACPLGLLVTPTIANNSLEPRRDGLLLMRFPYREWPVSYFFSFNKQHKIDACVCVLGKSEACHRSVARRDWTAFWS
jgi:N terminus of Notch ligand